MNLKIGDTFKDTIKVLRGYDREKNEPIVEDIESEWEVLDIRGNAVLAISVNKSKTKETKMFLMQ